MFIEEPFLRYPKYYEQQQEAHGIKVNKFVSKFQKWQGAFLLNYNNFLISVGLFANLIHGIDSKDVNFMLLYYWSKGDCSRKTDYVNGDKWHLNVSCKNITFLLLWVHVSLADVKKS